MPVPVQAVFWSYQSGKMVGPKPLVTGKQTLLNEESLVVNWKLPFDIT